VSAAVRGIESICLVPGSFVKNHALREKLETIANGGDVLTHRTKIAELSSYLSCSIQALSDYDPASRENINCFEYALRLKVVSRFVWKGEMAHSSGWSSARPTDYGLAREAAGAVSAITNDELRTLGMHRRVHGQETAGAAVNAAPRGAVERKT
jgi:hypothetical protein